MQRIPRPLLAFLILLLLTATGYGALWLHAAGLVRDGLAQWTAARRAEGYTVDYGTPSISAFPFMIRLRVERAAMVAPAQGWRWTSQGIEATVKPWSLRTVALQSLGPQEVSFHARDGGETVTASAAEAHGFIIIGSSGRVERTMLDAAGVSLSAPTTIPQPITATTAHAEVALPPGTAAAPSGPGLPPSTSLAFRIQDLTIPEVAAGPLGPRLSLVSVSGQILGTVPAGNLHAALTAWRDAGGTAEIKSLDLVWGSLRLSGNATVALDPAMQPEGAGTTEIRGYAEMVDALVAKGLVRASDAGFIKAGLGLLAKTPPDGGPKVLKVPLTVQGQTLSVGPIRLLRIPRINWPE